MTASVDVTNTGGRAGDEVVQLYIHDPVASISQPVRRLRGFERVTLDPGQTKTVRFHARRVSDFGFYDNRGRFVVEPGPDRRVRGRQLERDAHEVADRHSVDDGLQSRQGLGVQPVRDVEADQVERVLVGQRSGGTGVPR